MSSEFLDTLLDIQAHAIFGVSVAETDNSLNSLFSQLMRLLMLLCCVRFALGIDGVRVCVSKGLGEVFGELQCALEFIRFQVVVDSSGRRGNLRLVCNSLYLLDKWCGLACYRIAEGGVSLGLEDLSSGKVSRFALASLRGPKELGLLLCFGIGGRCPGSGSNCDGRGSLSVQVACSMGCQNLDTSNWKVDQSKRAVSYLLRPSMKAGLTHVEA